MQTIVYAVILALILAAIMALAYKPVRKYRVVIYVITAIVEAYFILPNALGYELIVNQRAVTSMFTMGILAEALFAVVAYTGCLPSKWKVTHRLKSIRAELSVMGCIISIGEVLYFAPQFISFFNGELSVGREIATIATIILVVLMIPLMLTSFYCVRANMNPKSWKKLQSTAYLFYFGLWLHIFGLYASLNGGLADLFTGKHGEALICYTVLWGVYFIVRFIKLAIDRHNKVPANDQIIQDDDDLVPAREE